MLLKEFNNLVSIFFGSFRARRLRLLIFHSSVALLAEELVHLGLELSADALDS
jgi:hypothetical protein